MENPNARPLASADTFATVRDAEGRPVATVTRPRMYGDSCPGMAEARGLFRLADTSGRLVAVFAINPTARAIARELAAFARAGAGIADMETAREVVAEERDALAREAANMETARAASFDTFRASAINRAIRAARRAEIAGERLAACPRCDSAGEVSGAAPGLRGTCPRCEGVGDVLKAAPAVDPAEVRRVAMRASVPALTAAERSLARRMATATGAEAAALAIRARIVAEVRELKAEAIPGTLADAFALRPVPRATYDAPMTAEAGELAAELARNPGTPPAEVVAEIEDSELVAREVVAIARPGERWTLTRAGIAAGLAAVAFASPASAEIAAGHFHAAPGTLDSVIASARELALASPALAFAGVVALAAAFATWTR